MPQPGREQRPGRQIPRVKAEDVGAIRGRVVHQRHDDTVILAGAAPLGQAAAMEVVHYGTLAHPDGAGRREVEGVALESSALGLSVVTLGATLLEVTAPDRHGRHEPVCLAPRTLAELEAVAFGYVIPIFFVVTGVTYDLDALLHSVKALVMVPLFLVSFLIVRGVPVRFYLAAPLVLDDDPIVSVVDATTASSKRGDALGAGVSMLLGGGHNFKTRAYTVTVDPVKYRAEVTEALAAVGRTFADKLDAEL